MKQEVFAASSFPMEEPCATVVRHPWGLHPKWLLAIFISIPLVASLFWWLGTTFFQSQLTLLEFQQFAVLITGVTAGGYQLYFWVQRNNLHVPARSLDLPIDRQIPFRPRWIWLYSIFHFVMIGLTVVSIRSPGDGLSLVFGGLLVLVTGSVIFYFFPTDIPESFRSFEVKCLSTRYLAFIQSMDSSRNAFPSMHCAIATYVGLVLASVPAIGPWPGYTYIAAIALSCLYVKQHVLVDTVGGIVLGAFVYQVNQWLAVVL